MNKKQSITKILGNMKPKSSEIKLSTKHNLTQIIAFLPTVSDVYYDIITVQKKSNNNKKKKRKTKKKLQKNVLNISISWKPKKVLKVIHAQLFFFVLPEQVA